MPNLEPMRRLCPAKGLMPTSRQPWKERILQSYGIYRWSYVLPMDDKRQRWNISAGTRDVLFLGGSVTEFWDHFELDSFGAREAEFGNVDYDCSSLLRQRRGSSYHDGRKTKKNKKQKQNRKRLSLS